MPIRVALNHKTEYYYDRPVSLSPHLVRLIPAPHCRTPIISRSMKITPAKHFINYQQDPFSNNMARIVFPEKITEFKVEVDLVAELTALNPFDFFLEPGCEKYPFVYEKALAKELAPFLEIRDKGPKMLERVSKIDKRERACVDFLVDVNQAVQKEVKYIIRMEPGVQTCEETLTKGSGSCRDSAWLLTQLFRYAGLAARFVSGYLIQLAPDQKSLDGPSGPEKDFTDLHAWTEVFLPGAGWVGLDPTNGLFAGEGNIPLACTPDPSGASPITGALDECETEFKFSMEVTRIFESPRVTKPYTDKQWESILEAGRLVDKRLQAGDVRLTMGGEPTFVSIDDHDGAEWNTSALGPTKRKLGATLLKRMRDKLDEGALLHYGQGKWYPGEPLPRWALGCYWRKDGEAIWTKPDLYADDHKKYGFSEDTAQKFAQKLASKLSVNAEHIYPGYEDPWHHMMLERTLPANIDPLKNNLKDAVDRARMAKVFEQGLDKVVGYSLPLQRAWHDGVLKWQSGAWTFRRNHLFLIPGDSPMGYRLPLESLPYYGKGDVLTYNEEDPLETSGKLPPRSQFDLFAVPMNRPARQEATIQIQKRDSRSGKRRDNGEPEGGMVPGAEQFRPRMDQLTQVVRTSLCVEARDGYLYVFLPPQRFLEDYLNLTAAVEATAADCDTPVFIEGYTPPNDARLDVLKVTPDPGVIEVNVQPVKTWDDLVNNTTLLYDEARQSRLGTDKFMLDGRHTGTGGGNHIIIGAESPIDSPVLRRPDLLRSLVSYWHNHPALSYMFSCQFVGPTSQAPRIDDARNDSLYELETAFERLPAAGSNCPPWLVDRMFRHLLVDMTGNTHRAEFCIDKLYSPDSSSGRLGLLEFRGFEMPPHARMSLAQQLLMRALVAHFWEQPYTANLVRWGTDVHDRFMLPHFAQQDFNDVIKDLNRNGFPLKPEWFETHFEFRYPYYGHIERDGIKLELRQAIEPWHVLGEEVVVSGTTRYVDSSVERMQVKVQGMTDSRHAVICNGRRVPLHPTGTNGEFVAGVRFRAWQPSSCLHPTIGVQTPLVFDILDGWNKHSIGACQYHVAHPGGRNNERFPINALEAESRRIARFFALGHTPRTMEPPPVVLSPEYPFTLDLRRFPGTETGGFQ